MVFHVKHSVENAVHRTYLTDSVELWRRAKQIAWYSRFMGNDLSTPIPEFGFPGLKQGDAWCLCAARWLQAYEDGMAPRVYLMRTHQKALDIVPLELLKKHAADLS